MELPKADGRPCVAGNRVPSWVREEGLLAWGVTCYNVKNGWLKLLWAAYKLSREVIL